MKEETIGLIITAKESKTIDKIITVKEDKTTDKITTAKEDKTTDKTITAKEDKTIDKITMAKEDKEIINPMVKSLKIILVEIVLMETKVVMEKIDSLIKIKTLILDMKRDSSQRVVTKIVRKIPLRVTLQMN